MAMDIEKVIKILFIHQSWKGFEQTDYGILSRNFEAKEALVYKNFYYKTFFLLKKIYKTDIIFCWFAYRSALPLILVAKIMRKKIIVVASGWEAANAPDIDYGAMREGSKFCLNKLIVRAILTLSDNILAVSEFNCLELKLNAGVPKSKIKIIYLGVDENKLGDKVLKKKNMVLTVGQINCKNMSRKGLNVFVEVARLLPLLDFILIGGTKKDLESYIEKPAPGNLKIIPFSLNKAKKYYRQAKVYVQVSRHENFGLSLAEAMSYECVPVVTNQAALPEVVKEAGYYVEYNNVDSTVAAIQLALSDKERGGLARQRIERFFSLQKREKALVNVIREVMKEK
jgi:glycosyltransferase involved in cell wall biosynthesis